MKHRSYRIVPAALLTFACFLFGQSALVGLQQFYDELNTSPPTAEVPLERINSLLRPLETAPPFEVVQALPALRQAARHNNIYVRLSAVVALLNIALTRMDSADLLASQLDILEEWMNQGDPRIADGGLMILSYLKPLPPPQVIPILLRYAALPDTSTKRQATALAITLKREQFAVAMKQPSQAEQIIPAVERFARRSLDRASRITLFDGIGLIRGGDPRLNSIVVSGMSDTDAAVRTRSLYNLMRLGAEEVRKVGLEVERLRTQDPDAEVRAEADKALRVMGGESPFPPGPSK